MTVIQTQAPDHDVIIVGGGFSGLGMAIRLRSARRDNFLVLEQADSVGGTWRANDYPGCACDVPSHLYSFSFALNPDWSRMFAPRGEIRDYLEGTATEFGIRPRLRLGARMTAADYDERAGLWRVEVNGAETLTARVLVSAIGALNKPAIPNLAGRERFTGPAVHSAEWGPEFDLEGKTVAVIGTGASAIQIVPELAPKTERLYVFQRTAPWIIPKRDRRIPVFQRRLYRRFPALQRAHRRLIYWLLEARVVGFAHQPRLLGAVQKIAAAHIRRQVRDPELRSKVTPDYTIGCKRILISNDYYPALSRDDVELVCEPIVALGERSVTTADGVERDVDAIVYGTGFRVQRMLAELPIRGRDRRALNEVWDERGMQAHRGTTIAGFPNLFMLLGPNTGLGHTSIVHMIESQVHYVVEALEAMDAAGLRAVEPRRRAQDEFNRELQSRLAGAVWSLGGCRSWYLDDSGRNTTLWPDFTFRFRNQLSEFELAEYEGVGARPRPERDRDLVAG